jgi:phage baseplate assembly protein W
MATIYLDNLINPRQAKSSTTVLSKETNPHQSIFSDLHLDLVTVKNPGVGLTPVESKDIKSDVNLDAIKNSLYNIFSTMPGQKILSPSFGSNLNQYLFEPIDVVRAHLIGNDVLAAISKFEPRIQVINIEVYPYIDQQMYQIKLVYQFLNKPIKLNTTIQLQSNNITIL